MYKQIWTLLVTGALFTCPIAAKADPSKPAERKVEAKESPAQRAADRRSAAEGRREMSPAQKSAERAKARDARERALGNREMSPAQKAASRAHK